MNQRKVLCGVPFNNCCGVLTGTNFSLKSSNHGMKTHATHEEAFFCYKQWLLSQGYEQIGPREFCKDNGPVVVLTKKCRFGGTLRKGKSGETSTNSGSRWEPNSIGSGVKAGIIVST